MAENAEGNEPVSNAEHGALAWHVGNAARLGDLELAQVVDAHGVVLEGADVLEVPLRVHCQVAARAEPHRLWRTVHCFAFCELERSVDLEQRSLKSRCASIARLPLALNHTAKLQIG